MTVAFSQVFGREAEACCVAPGRVNLIGEYTDLNESYVLPLAIPAVTTVHAARRGDCVLGVCTSALGGLDRAEIALDSAGTQHGWTAYPAAVARAFLDEGFTLTGADLLIESSVPVGAGLSSSAALECSVALALCALFDVTLAPIEVARLARRAENVYVGVPCGVMDQAASMCCQVGHALLLDTRNLSMRQVPFDVVKAGLSLLVIDTRVSHGLGDSGYATRKAACAQAARLLGVPALRDLEGQEIESALSPLRDDPTVAGAARHVLSEQQRVLAVAAILERGSLEEIGPVLTASHRSLRDDLVVSCPELDLAVDTAIGAGALGARLTGGGFGGSAIALVHAARTGVVTAEIVRAFATAGFKAPVVFPVAPSAGAGRLW